MNESADPLAELRSDFERLRGEHVSFREDAEARLKSADEAVAAHSTRAEALAAELEGVKKDLAAAKADLVRVPAAAGAERQVRDVSGMSPFEKIREGLASRVTS